jgi:hypothetical protein
MSALEKRIGRLEEKFGEDREPRVIIVTIDPNNFPEDPYLFELPDGLWVLRTRRSVYGRGDCPTQKTSTDGSNTSRIGETPCQSLPFHGLRRNPNNSVLCKNSPNVWRLDGLFGA